MVASTFNACVVIDTRGKFKRVLDFRCGDVFDSLEPHCKFSPSEQNMVAAADIILLNTDFPGW